MSEYGVRIDGSCIIPISAMTALQWARPATSLPRDFANAAMASWIAIAGAGTRLRRYTALAQSAGHYRSLLAVCRSIKGDILDEVAGALDHLQIDWVCRYRHPMVGAALAWRRHRMLLTSSGAIRKRPRSAHRSRTPDDYRYMALLISRPRSSATTVRLPPTDQMAGTLVRYLAAAIASLRALVPISRLARLSEFHCRLAKDASRCRLRRAGLIAIPRLTGSPVDSCPLMISRGKPDRRYQK